MGQPKNTATNLENEIINAVEPKSEIIKQENFVDESKMTVDRSYVEELRGEAAKNRLKEKEAKEATELALLENQQYKALAENYKTRLSEYEKNTLEMQDDLQKTANFAKKWVAHEERLDAEIQKLSENITEDDKSILSSISDVSRRYDFLLRILNTNNKQTAPDLSQPQNLADQISVEDMLKQGKTADEITKSNGIGWIDKLLNKNKPTLSDY
jgi:hypothetical protein